MSVKPEKSEDRRAPVMKSAGPPPVRTATLRACDQPKEGIDR